MSETVIENLIGVAIVLVVAAFVYAGLNHRENR